MDFLIVSNGPKINKNKVPETCNMVKVQFPKSSNMLYDWQLQSLKEFITSFLLVLITCHVMCITFTK